MIKITIEGTPTREGFEPGPEVYECEDFIMSAKINKREGMIRKAASGVTEGILMAFLITNQSPLSKMVTMTELSKHACKTESEAANTDEPMAPDQHGAEQS